MRQFWIIKKNPLMRNERSHGKLVVVLETGRRSVSFFCSFITTSVSNQQRCCIALTLVISSALRAKLNLRIFYHKKSNIMESFYSQCTIPRHLNSYKHSIVQRQEQQHQFVLCLSFLDIIKEFGNFWKIHSK